MTERKRMGWRRLDDPWFFIKARNLEIMDHMQGLWLKIRTWRPWMEIDGLEVKA